MTPLSCRCGANFSINHVLTCKQGGWHTIRHSDLIDSLTDLLSNVCSEVVKEPHLQALSGSTYILPPTKKMKLAWTFALGAFGLSVGMHFLTFGYFSLRILILGYQSFVALKQHERQKRCEYGQHIREIEHGGFTPLVFSTSGGMAPEAAVFLK